MVYFLFYMITFFLFSCSIISPTKSIFIIIFEIPLRDFRISLLNTRHLFYSIDKFLHKEFILKVCKTRRDEYDESI